MQKYIGTKIIEAVPAIRKGGNVYEEGWPIPKSMDPTEEGYKVRYPDGYESWSPKGVFEEAYRPTDCMSFGLAIEAMKKGKKVARRGWNGKGMFLFLGTDIELHTEADLSCVSNLEGDLTLPSIVMKTADDHFCVGWLASQTDMLADDWEVVE